MRYRKLHAGLNDFEFFSVPPFTGWKFTDGRQKCGFNTVKGGFELSVEDWHSAFSTGWRCNRHLAVYFHFGLGNFIGGWVHYDDLPQDLAEHLEDLDEEEREEI